MSKYFRHQAIIRKVRKVWQNLRVLSRAISTSAHWPSKKVFLSNEGATTFGKYSHFLIDDGLKVLKIGNVAGGSKNGRVVDLDHSLDVAKFGKRPVRAQRVRGQHNAALEDQAQHRCARGNRGPANQNKTKTSFFRKPSLGSQFKSVQLVFPQNWLKTDPSAK